MTVVLAVRMLPCEHCHVHHDFVIRDMKTELQLPHPAPEVNYVMLMLKNGRYDVCMWHGTGQLKDQRRILRSSSLKWSVHRCRTRCQIALCKGRWLNKNCSRLWVWRKYFTLHISYKGSENLRGNEVNALVSPIVQVLTLCVPSHSPRMNHGVYIRGEWGVAGRVWLSDGASWTLPP